MWLRSSTHQPPLRGPPGSLSHGRVFMDRHINEDGRESGRSSTCTHKIDRELYMKVPRTVSFTNPVCPYAFSSNISSFIYIFIYVCVICKQSGLFSCMSVYVSVYFYTCKKGKYLAAIMLLRDRRIFIRSLFNCTCQKRLWLWPF